MERTATGGIALPVLDGGSLRRLLGVALLVVAALGWSGAWITARWAAGEAPPLSVATGRFLLAALALLPWWWQRERAARCRVGRRELALLLAMGASGAASYTVLFLLGLSHAPASDGAVVAPGVGAVMAVLLGAWLGGERPSRGQLAGLVCGLAGTALVGAGAFAAAETDGARWLGNGCFVASAVVFALYGVLGRRLARRVGPLTAVLGASLCGALLLLPLALFLEGVPELSAWSGPALLNVLYLGLGATALASVAHYQAVSLLGVAAAAPALALVPVFGVLGAVVLLGEPAGLTHAAGGALVLLGVVVSASARRA